MNNAYIIRKRVGDFYETPEWATEALFSKEKFEGKVWEPACGDNAMVRVIEKHNACVATDILSGTDFLATTSNFNTANIITNPPYSITQKFVLTAKLWAEKKIAMLMRLTFLEGQARKKMFEDKEFPLKAVYVFSKRVQMFPHGEDKPKNSSMMAYAWYVWDKKHIGEPILRWI